MDRWQQFITDIEKEHKTIQQTFKMWDGFLGTNKAGLSEPGYDHDNVVAKAKRPAQGGRPVPKKKPTSEMERL